MGVKLSLRVVLVVVVFAVLGLAVWLWFHWVGAGGGVGGATEKFKWVSDVSPASGAGSAPEGVEGDGPWNHRLLIAVSADGVNWVKTLRVLSDQASVPDVVVDRDGFVRVYYVDFFNGGIVVAVSRDLAGWAYVSVKGLNASWVDPSVVVLPDGRFRLYASYMPPEGRQNKVVSAVSEDGVHFTVEPGVRFEWDGVVTDPDVIYADGVWVMYVEVRDEKGQRILMLTSEDGLNFKLKGEVKVEGDVPCLVDVGDGFRLYVHSRDVSSILSYFSKDLKSWSGPDVVLERGEPGSLDGFGVADPAVAVLPNGTYVMVYKTWIEKPVFEEEAGVAEAAGLNVSDERFYRFGLGAKLDEVTTARLAFLLGLDWVRLDSVFVWGEIEPSKGVFDFEGADSVIRSIQEYGIRVIAKFTAYAEWDYRLNPKQGKGKPGMGPLDYKPNDLEAYKEFVRRVVERYDGDGVDDMPGLKYPIKFWTILNEPGAQFLGTGKEYAETLRASYEAIKEADPEAKVIIAAPGDVGLQVLGTEFWREALTYSKGYFDYGNIHYNVGASGIDEGGFEDLSRGFRFYRDYLESFGITGVKVWGTEISPAPGHLPTDEKARLWVVGSVKSFAEGAVGLKYPFVFLEDEKMLRMFLTLTTLLKNFDSVEKVGEGCYRFRVGGADIYVVWKPGRLPSGLSGRVYVVDVYGDVREVDAGSVEPSDMPLYVLKDSDRVRALQDRLRELDSLRKELEDVLASAKPPEEAQPKPPPVNASKPAIVNATIDRLDEEDIRTVRFGDIVVTYDADEWEAYPVDRWLKRWFRVKNVGGEPVTIYFEVQEKTEKGGWVPSGSWFPQPWVFDLYPGEEQTLWYFTDFSMFVHGIDRPTVFDLRLLIRNEKTKEEYYVYFRNRYVEDFEMVWNSLLRVRVLDESGSPLEGVEVTVHSISIPEPYEARYYTDKDGYALIPLFAHVYRDSKQPHGYSLSFKKEGYYEKFRVVFPRVGEEHEITVKLKKLDPKIRYELVKCLDTGYSTWYVKVRDGCVVFAHGHYKTEGEAVSDERHGIYFMDLGGNVIWHKHTEYAVWGIDVSDDCSLVFAMQLRKENGFMLDGKGNVLWETRPELGWPPRLESREVAISHNKKYVAVGGGDGRLFLEDDSPRRLLWKAFLRGQIRQLRFTRDDKILYASSGDGYLYKLDVETGEILGKAYVEAWLYRNSLSISEDEKYAFTISKIGRACLVDLEDMRVLWCFDTRGGGHATSMTRDASFLALASGGSYGRIVFDFNGTPLWYVSMPSWHVQVVNDSYVLFGDMLFDLDGNLIYDLAKDYGDEYVDLEFSYMSEDMKLLITMKDGRICFFRRSG